MTMEMTPDDAKAAFAANASPSAHGNGPIQAYRNERHRHPGTAAFAVAVACSVILTVGEVSAFSPPCHHRLQLLQHNPISISNVHDSHRHRSSSSSISIIATASLARRIRPDRSRSRSLNRLYYKHLDGDDDNSIRADAHAKNETASSFEPSDKDVIFYNDLDSSDSTTDVNNVNDHDSSSDNEDDNDSDGLIHELEDVIKQNNIKLTPKSSSAIEPSESKPSKKFISPIEMIKKVPKVEPIHMSTVFFLKLIGDPLWPRGGRKKKEGDNNGNDGSSSMNKNKSKPAVENWKTRMEKRNKKSTEFRATSYLQSLSADANTKNDNNKDNDSKSSKDKEDAKDLLKDLKDQQANLVITQLKSQQQAMYDAMRRTHPQEAYDNRMKEGQKEREEKERQKLEQLYVERKERLDAKKRNEARYAEERERQRKLLEMKAREREELKVEAAEAEAAAAEAAAIISEIDASGIDNGDGKDKDEAVSSSSTEMKKHLPSRQRSAKRGMPILDRPSFLKAPPLLVGSTLTFRYSELTPFQQRAIEVAQWHHADHCERMKIDDDDDELVAEASSPFAGTLAKAGDEGGIQAAPIIALIDSYTIDPDESSLASIQQGKPKKRFATLASIEITYDSDTEEPYSVKLMGVGRVFLQDYFSSKDAGKTVEEEELSQLLEKMQAIDRKNELYDDDDDDAETTEHATDEDEDDALPVVMAQFDLFLDDSSIISKETSKYGEDVTKHRASSMHAITELYRSANKVYRLHEERKKLVAGLRAGEARLRLGKERAIDEYCDVEFEDCDGLGMIGGMMDNPMGEEEEQEVEVPSPSSGDTTPRSILETLDNYGLGSYGILSTIPDLTKRLMSHLEPYYSPNHREREEYEAEVASMVVFRTLEEYASAEEVAAALLAPNATQRLEMAYVVMMRHREELYELVEIVSQELSDCGEECTDLW